MVPVMREELAKRIAAVLTLPGMNKVLLTYLAGIHRQTLEGYDSDAWNPTAQTLERLDRVVIGFERMTKEREGYR